LANRHLPLLEVLGDLLVDSVTDLQLLEHASDQTQMVENLALWRVTFPELGHFSLF
jgi:hypothetical protein